MWMNAGILSIAAIVAAPWAALGHGVGTGLNHWSQGALHFAAGWDHWMLALTGALLLGMNRTHRLSGGAALGALFSLPILMHALAHGMSLQAALGSWAVGVSVLAATLLILRKSARNLEGAGETHRPWVARAGWVCLAAACLMA